MRGYISGRSRYSGASTEIIDGYRRDQDELEDKILSAFAEYHSAGLDFDSVMEHLEGLG